MRNKIGEEIKRQQKARAEAENEKPAKGYNSRYAVIAQGLALQGMKQSEMAGIFGVSPSTITVWAKKHNEFREAIETGRAMAGGELAGTAHLLATGQYVFTEKKLEFDKTQGRLVERVCRRRLPPSEQMLKFLLPNVAPDAFVERRDVNLSADGIKVDIQVVDEL